MPVETEEFPCGTCRKPVQTQWVVGEPRNGLLRGPYELIGDVVFCDVCAGNFANEWMNDPTHT